MKNSDSLVLVNILFTRTYYYPFRLKVSSEMSLTLTTFEYAGLSLIKAPVGKPSRIQLIQRSDPANSKKRRITDGVMLRYSTTVPCKHVFEPCKCTGQQHDQCVRRTASESFNRCCSFDSRIPTRPTRLPNPPNRSCPCFRA